MQAAPPMTPRRRRFPLAPYVYLTPLIVGTLLFTFVPAAYNVYISFTNWSMFNFRRFRLIGLENYYEIFSEGSSFLPVISWTVTWTLLSTALNIGVGLFLALLLNNPHMRERGVYRTLLIIPWALPFILTVQMWAGLFNIDGAFNMILGAFGFEKVRWLRDPLWARVAVLTVNVWLSYPFFMVVCLAALQSIPRELYEAARIDGASSWQSFARITFPLLSIAILPLLITQIAFQFNNFGVIYLLTGGGPVAYVGADYGVTDILVTYTYKLMRDAQRYGLTAAYGVVIFFIVAGITIINARVTRAFREEDR